jgi:hypothetical protein
VVQKKNDSSRRRWGSSESKARAWLHSLAVAQALMLELYVTRSSMFISWMDPDGNSGELLWERGSRITDRSKKDQTSFGSLLPTQKEIV